MNCGIGSSSLNALAVLGVDNKWAGIENKAYYPGLEFRDEKGEKTMSLFGTGISVWYRDQRSRLDFTGLEIGDKDTGILLNPKLFSFQAKEGQLLLLPHPSGVNLTIHNMSDNEFGVVTDADVASFYAASPKWELDLTADKRGTHVERSLKRKAQ